jgi:hypothetical protein
VEECESLLCGDDGSPVAGDALVGAINAVIAECMTVEALKNLAAMEEAPPATFAVGRCTLTPG